MTEVKQVMSDDSTRLLNIECNLNKNDTTSNIEVLQVILHRTVIVIM